MVSTLDFRSEGQWFEYSIFALTCFQDNKCLACFKVSSLEISLFTRYIVNYFARNRPERFVVFEKVEGGGGGQETERKGRGRWDSKVEKSRNIAQCFAIEKMQRDGSQQIHGEVKEYGKL